MSNFNSTFWNKSSNAGYCKPPIANNFYSVDAAPASSPAIVITLQQAKDHLLVTFSDDDTIIADMLSGSIATIEKFCGISINEQTISILADIWFEFELPLGPVKAFTSSSIKTNVNTYTALVVNTDYEIDNSLQFPRYRPFQTGRMKLVYTTGYGIATPEDLKLAILNELAFRYESRGDGSSSQRNTPAGQSTAIESGICHAALSLASPYKRMAIL